MEWSSSAATSFQTATPIAPRATPTTRMMVSLPGRRSQRTGLSPTRPTNTPATHSNGARGPAGADRPTERRAPTQLGLSRTLGSDASRPICDRPLSVIEAVPQGFLAPLDPSFAGASSSATANLETGRQVAAKRARSSVRTRIPDATRLVAPVNPIVHRGLHVQLPQKRVELPAVLELFLDEVPEHLADRYVAVVG